MNPTKPLIVGLSGKYCAGKSTIGYWLESRGAFHIEADLLGHQAIVDCQEQIVKRFGTAILSAGLIDRKALGRLVFGKPEELAALEAIVHPAVRQAIAQLIEQGQPSRQTAIPLGHSVESAQPALEYSGLVVLNAALLFKSGLNELCTVVFWVTAPWLVRLWRGLGRDKRGFRGTMALMASQTMLGPQHPAPNADIIKVINVWGQCARSRVRQSLERYNG